MNIQEAKLVLYADDTNIFVIGTDKALQAKLSSVMKQLEVWFLKNDLLVNTTEMYRLLILQNTKKEPTIWVAKFLTIFPIA